jgi:hypothetical protein
MRLVVPSRLGMPFRRRRALGVAMAGAAGAGGAAGPGETGAVDDQGTPAEEGQP